MSAIATQYEDKPAKLLIVDDDPVMLSQLGLALGEDFDVFTANGPDQAWDALRTNKPEIVTLDLALEHNNPESGFSLLERCLEYDPLIKVVMITGNGAQENALRAVDQGAFDFFSKPVDVEELRHLLRRAQIVARLERQNAALMARIGEERRLGHLLGQSPEMKAVFAVIQRVAPTDVAALILGESGTGKELVARELRRLSQRASKPFVSISCGAIPENLLESELFGHEKGSFTSAHTSRPGKLEAANKGTVFLDEIGELPLSLQVKILRAIQEKIVVRVGDTRPEAVDIRIVAATNRELEGEIRGGRFREDLYYRLNVVNLHLPPLRDRGEDVLVIARYLLSRYTKEYDARVKGFSPNAGVAIRKYAWPGNIREMENRIKKAIVLAEGTVIGPDDLGLTGDALPEILPLSDAKDKFQREYINEVLALNNGNRTKTARDLGVDPRTIFRHLEKEDEPGMPQP